MTRKAMSIIGRIIGLLLVVALAFGITWCAKNWGTVQAESQKVWNKLFGKKDQQEQVQPTPNEEQINLDGLYYTFDFDGYIRFFRFKDNQFGNIERGGARGPDDKTITEIYLPSDWETQELTESYHTTEDEEYIRAYCKNPDGQDFVFAIYDKATKKLYYDFSNGEQLPGKTYEEQMLIEMVKFDKFVIHDHVHGRRSVFKEPTCTESGVVFIYCEDCRDMCDIEYPSSLGHDYVGGKCTRCGESDPNYVEEVASIDGLYYGVESDGSIKVFQIQDNKFVNFYGYTKNGDQSLIYLPQDWTTYIESGYSLTIEVNDTQIIAGITDYMEGYKDNEQLYEVYKNYFVYDKEANRMCVGKNKAVLTKIEEYDILPYEEPRIYVENNILHMTDMKGIDGTYTVYYRNSSTIDEGAYVAGNVTEFDLTTLFNHDPKLVSGDEYTIRVVFATTDGFLIQGYESIQYTVPNGETALTWQFNINSSLTFPSDSTIIFQVNFTSNGESFDQIQLSHGEPPYDLYTKMTYINSTTLTNKVVFNGSNAWESYGEAYRTITFETAPTGDLLAWLQANATPQA